MFFSRNFKQVEVLLKWRTTMLLSQQGWEEVTLVSCPLWASNWGAWQSFNHIKPLPHCWDSLHAACIQPPTSYGIISPYNFTIYLILVVFMACIIMLLLIGISYLGWKKKSLDFSDKVVAFSGCLKGYTIWLKIVNIYIYMAIK